MEITLRALSELEARRHLKNPKEHDVPKLRASMRRFGFTLPPALDAASGVLVAGHGRLKALRAMRDAGEDPPARVVARDDDWLVPTLEGLDFADELERDAYLVADNRLQEAGGWDEKALAEMLQGFKGTDLEAIGYTPVQYSALLARFGADATPRESLADKFLVPPFSVLDARQGYWRDRKRAWLRLGIDSGQGRAEKLTSRIWHAEEKSGHKVSEGTSIFDPVLCEIVYRWFCPPGGRVWDPFAGGSVRGVVAAACGLHYKGMDLRQEQVDANIAQLEQVRARVELPGSATWVQGDSGAVGLDTGILADLVFSCPPYYDLERYSDDPNDLSNAASYRDFLVAYQDCLRNAVRQLRDGCCIAMVVGDIRDADGGFRGFHHDTVEILRGLGCNILNEAVLVTPVGTLAMRAAFTFPVGRKLGAGHQHLIVAIKGDIDAPREWPPIEVAMDAVRPDEDD